MFYLIQKKKPNKTKQQQQKNNLKKQRKLNFKRCRIWVCRMTLTNDDDDSTYRIPELHWNHATSSPLGIL